MYSEPHSYTKVSGLLQGAFPPGKVPFISQGGWTLKAVSKLWRTASSLSSRTPIPRNLKKSVEQHLALHAYTFFCHRIEHGSFTE